MESIPCPLPHRSVLFAEQQLHGLHRHCRQDGASLLLVFNGRFSWSTELHCQRAMLGLNKDTNRELSFSIHSDCDLTAYESFSLFPFLQSYFCDANAVGIVRPFENGTWE